MRKFAFLIAILLTLSACGRGQGNENDASEESGIVFGVHLGYAPSLTISTPTGIAYPIIEAAASLTNRFAGYGIDIRVEIENFIPTERDRHFDNMLSKFAAGMGPDIFVPDGFSLYRFIENGFLQDIYGFIDESENWSREDFFEQALRGHEIGGRLYAMPMSFGFDFVGINANVPQRFLDTFGSFINFSMDTLALMYLDLISDYPEWADFAFIHFENYQRAFAPQLNHWIDFADQSVNLFDGYGGFMDVFRDAFVDNNRFGTELLLPPITEENMQLLQDRYVFLRPLLATEALFDFQTSYFLDFIPLATNGGELISYQWALEVTVSANADSLLAWAFIEELLAETASGGVAWAHILQDGTRDRICCQVLIGFLASFLPAQS